MFRIIDILSNFKWEEIEITHDIYKWLSYQKSPLTRQIIEMRIEGYTIKEIAQMCKKSESAIETRLYRARKRLRAYLGY